MDTDDLMQGSHSSDPIHRNRHEVVEECLLKLGEYFDCVQILASWSEQCQTAKCFVGAGNFFARQGMAHTFINQDIAEDNAQQIAMAIGPSISMDFDLNEDEDDDDMESLGSA